MRLAPTNPTYPFLIAQVRLSTLQGATGTSRGEILKTAESDLKKAIALKSDLLEAYFVLAQLYGEEDRLDEAEAMLRTVLQTNPQFAAARYLLAFIYEKQGKVGQAKNELQTLLNTNPNNTELRAKLESLQAKK